MEDLYRVLRVGVHVSTAELRRRYRLLCRELHPDRTGNDPVRTRRFKQVQNAYSVLSDPLLRERYDVEWHRAFGESRRRGRGTEASEGRESRGRSPPGASRGPEEWAAEAERVRRQWAGMREEDIDPQRMRYGRGGEGPGFVFRDDGWAGRAAQREEEIEVMHVRNFGAVGVIRRSHGVYGEGTEDNYFRRQSKRAAETGEGRWFHVVEDAVSAFPSSAESTASSSRSREPPPSSPPPPPPVPPHPPGPFSACSSSTSSSSHTEEVRRMQASKMTDAEIVQKMREQKEKRDNEEAACVVS